MLSFNYKQADQCGDQHDQGQSMHVDVWIYLTVMTYERTEAHWYRG